MGGGMQQNNAPMAGPYRQVIFFGDSITEFADNQTYVDDQGKESLGFAFLPAVQSWLVRRFDVLNRGFSGYNTASAKIILPQFMPKPEQATVSLISIFFGANDAALRIDGPENQHVPLEQYKKNLKTIIHDASITNHNARILLIAPGPINEYQLDACFLAGSRKAAITKQYARACVDVAKEEKVEVLDLWSEMIKHIGWDSSKPGVPGSKDLAQHSALAALFTDGLHFSAEGYKLLYDSFVAKVKSTWPELEEMSAEGYDAVFPLWRDAMGALHTGQDILPRLPRV